MLRKEGFDISTSTIIDIQKVLANISDEELSDFTELKSILSPFICRNKEEQERFSALFDKYVNLIRAKPVELKKEPQPQRKKWLAPVIAGTAILLAIAGIFLLSGDRTKPVIQIKTSVEKDSGETYVLVNEPVRIEADISDSSLQSSLSIQVGDSIYANRQSLLKTFVDTGIYPVQAWVMKNGDTLARSNAQIDVRCEQSPSVRIEKDSASMATNKVYRAVFRNASSDSTKYKYKWHINDNVASTEPVFTTSYKSDSSYLVWLFVDLGGTHCSTDSLTAYLNETPQYRLAVTGTRPIEARADLDWNVIIPAVLFSLMIPGIFAAIILRFNRKKRKPKLTATYQPDDQEYSGPYKIEFKTQDENIVVEKEISQLADAMRKRHIGEVMFLDVDKTINKTIRSAGFPTLQFTPRTQPTDFLVFLDKGNADSHQVQLFEYFLGRLRNEQVNLTTYHFHKEPLVLSNDKFNHSMLPVEKVSRLYPNTILVIFSNTIPFFESLTTALKPWVTEKFKTWNHKIIITPVPVNDWDYKENALMKAGFTVVPADLNAHQLIDREITDHLNREKFKKFAIPNSYSSRFTNFDDWNELKIYLGNDPLLVQWVCALGVYPYADWKVTVAMGRAIEDANKRKDPLVTFTNLLKLSRIKWMHTGVLPDDLRLQMLQQLNPSNEITARKTIVRLLDEVKDQITPTSLIRDEYQLHHTVNKFLLHSNSPTEHVLTEEEKATMQEYVRNGALDYPLEKYLDNSDKTMLKNADGKPVPPNEYFSLYDEAEKKKEKVARLVRRMAAAVALLIGVVILFLFFRKPGNYQADEKFADLSFVINNDLPYPSTITSVRLQGESTVNATKINDSTYEIKDFLVDSSGARLFIETNPALGFERQMDLTSGRYRITIGQPLSRQRLLVRHNDQTAFQNIQQRLLGSLGEYDVVAELDNFSDSSKVMYPVSERNFADSVADIVNRDLGINVLKEADAQSTPALVTTLYLNLRTNTCSSVSLATLPSEVSEIWRGRTNNRLVNIDLRNKIIYYSTGSKATYGTYRIEEICLRNSIYKMITRANNEYQVFLLSISSGPSGSVRSISLGLCPERISSVGIARSVNESACNNPEEMTLYYENDNSKIFLTYPNSRIPSSQNRKIANIVNDGKSKQARDYRFTVHNNSTFTSASRTLNMSDLVSVSGLPQDQISYSYRDVRPFRGTPFDRTYVTIVHGDYPGNSNTPAITPDCSRTFSSLKEALSVDARVICRLNLEKENLTSIPRDLYSFGNMQELILGRTNIPEVQIRELQGALRGLKVVYSQATSILGEALLTKLQVSSNGTPDRKGSNDLEKIFKYLQGYPDASIRIIVYFENDYSEKTALSKRQNIQNYISKNYKFTAGQVSYEIRKSDNRQQQQQQQQNNIARTNDCEVFGKGFPANFISGSPPATD